MLLLIELTLLLYILTLWGEFVFDDLLILENTQKTWRVRSNMTWRHFCSLMMYQGRAFLWWTFRRDALAHGMTNPFGWHILNVCLHLINTVLMFTILRWWFSDMAAFAGAAVYLAHPIATASVSSISGRSSALCSVFVLGAIVAFLCHAWWLLPFMAILGLRSKEEVVTMLPSLLVVWWGR
jgi:hypothetical protein